MDIFNILLIISDNKKINIIIPDKVILFASIDKKGIVKMDQKTENEKNDDFLESFCIFFLRRFIELGNNTRNIDQIKDEFILKALEIKKEITEDQRKNIIEIKISIYEKVKSIKSAKK